MIEKDGGDNVDKNARGFITYGMLDSRERKETQHCNSTILQYKIFFKKKRGRSQR